MDVSFDRVVALGGNGREKGGNEVLTGYGVTGVTMIRTVEYGVMMIDSLPKG